MPQSKPEPRQSGALVYWFSGLKHSHGRLVAEFYADTMFGRDVRRIVLEAGPLWAPQDDTEEPVADPALHAELIARAQEELARARSVAVITAHERGEHFHRGPQRQHPVWRAA